MDNSELRGLLAKATPGEWARGEFLDSTRLHAADGERIAEVYGREDDDAALIIAAVNELPRLLADSEAYAKLRAEIAGLAEKWRGDAEFYRSGSEPDKSVAYDRCADELVALLRLPAGDSQDTTTRAQGEG